MTMHDACNKVISWWRDLDDDARAVALDAFAVRFSYNSGKIENDEITFRDTHEVFDRDGVTSYTGSLRTLFEIKNSKTAWEWLLLSVRNGVFIDETFLLEAHRLLTWGTYDEDRWAKGERPGTFKLGDYVVGARDTGAAACDVPEAIGNVLIEIREALNASNASKNALVIAAYLHAQIARIHPFADGNGRTARLLGNFILLTLRHPPISIDEADRLSYYGALDAFDVDGDLDPLVSFLKVELVKTWGERAGCTGHTGGLS
ncbi:Fic family protein [Adlercreutzia sp. ZJ138]|uniref:Fic family protein n=1 Tax=Adlercreutzia sp. ZJ138 TaxID=2709405 RepID=UPI0013EC10FC|nr:Fic family protein [Adlercreutzia sp. ZJ138]